MSDAEKLLKIGAKSYSDVPNLGTIFDHHWDKPEELTTIGELSREKVRKVTKELFDFPIPLTVNRLLADKNYDTILIFGGTIPHEVAGFAGGAKYFFPGVCRRGINSRNALVSRACERRKHHRKNRNADATFNRSRRRFDNRKSDFVHISDDSNG